MSEVTDYQAHGWKLCGIEPAHKAPTYPKWQVNPMDAEAIEAVALGVGLLHALSGTCALDLDNLDLARPWLAERGVDIDALLSAEDAVRIDSGRPGRAKLLYRMKRPMRTYKPKASGLELRCATGTGSSVQDVLPPTIHPDTKRPYEWLYGDLVAGHWSKLPPIPASLLALWRELEPGPDTDPLPDTPREAPLELYKLAKAANTHSPDCDYDEWLKVGMQLNDGTRGAQEGFDIWCKWSKGIKRAPYPGDGVLKTHWLSFGSGPGKHVAKGEALIAELPAEPDDFPLLAKDEPAGAATTEVMLTNQLRETRKEAIAALEQRLVYVVGVERYFDTERHRVIGSDNALEHLFTGMMPKTKGGGRMSPIKALKASNTKRIVDNLAFHPGKGAIFTVRDDTYANTYRNRLPAPIEPMKDELEKIDWLFNRIDDPVFRKWLLQFYGHVVQKPGIKINSAPLIWSPTTGNGKTTLLKMIPALLVGASYSEDVTSAVLHGNFTDYLRNAWHINLAEFRAGTRGERAAISSMLKPWIADNTVQVHPKGMPAYTMPNVFFVTAGSNEEDAASIDNEDRRWGVHEMHAPQFTEAEQEWIYPEFLLQERAAAVLRHYFLNVDLTGFSPSAAAPKTEARAEMVESSTPLDVEMLTTAWEQQISPFDRDVVLTSEAGDYIRRLCPTKPSNDRVGRILCRPPFNGTRYRFSAKGKTYRVVILRDARKWIGTPAAEILSHICNEDVDLLS